MRVVTGALDLHPRAGLHIGTCKLLISGANPAAAIQDFELRVHYLLDALRGVNVNYKIFVELHR